MEEYKIIGKIDINKLGKYKDTVTTDEVILTNERKGHIEERHKGHYELWEEHIQEILKNPDFILEDIEHENTIIILKELIKDDKRIKMVIKLAMNNFEKRYNSIITLWNIRQRDYSKTIVKNKIIYKKLDKSE